MPFLTLGGAELLRLVVHLCSRHGDCSDWPAALPRQQGPRELAADLPGSGQEMPRWNNNRPATRANGLGCGLAPTVGITSYLRARHLVQQR